MNKFATVIMAAAAATLLVTGCSKSDSTKIKVGFSQVGAESDWRKASTESIKGEAAKRGAATIGGRSAGTSIKRTVAPRHRGTGKRFFETERKHQ